MSRCYGALRTMKGLGDRAGTLNGKGTWVGTTVRAFHFLQGGYRSLPALDIRLGQSAVFLAPPIQGKAVSG